MTASGSANKAAFQPLFLSLAAGPPHRYTPCTGNKHEHFPITTATTFSSRADVPIDTMTDYLTRKHSGLSDNGEAPSTPSGVQASRSNPLSAKVTSVLSASYADSDLRDALELLDKRNIENSAETRRQIRLDVQKEVIESNGDIIKEFGHVAEVRRLSMISEILGLCMAAT